VSTGPPPHTPPLYPGPHEGRTLPSASDWPTTFFLYITSLAATFAAPPLQVRTRADAFLQGKRAPAAGNVNGSGACAPPHAAACAEGLP
jgi:hypothetical protein